MKSTTRGCCCLAALAGLMLVATAAVAAEMPAAPKVSTFAPAPALAAQLESYVSGLEEAAKDEDAYKESKTKVAKDANTVLLIALALGLHDTDNDYKAAAPALIEAAKKLAAAQDFSAASSGIKDLKAAMTAKGDASKLSWADAKDASLDQLMQQVPLVNTKLKRYARQVKTKGKEIPGATAVIAVIGQGSMALAEKTKKPGEAEAWYKHCAAMRDATVAVNAAAKAKDQAATDKAMEELTKSCDDCHAVFNPK